MGTATQHHHAPTLDRTDAGVFVGIGFVVWALATVVVRLLGPALLRPETPLVTAAVYLLMLPSMALLVVAAVRYREVTGNVRVLAATLLVLPGMALDSLVLPGFTTVFPGIDASMAGSFGGVLLVAYATALATGYLIR